MESMRSQQQVGHVKSTADAKSEALIAKERERHRSGLQVVPLDVGNEHPQNELAAPHIFTCSPPWMSFCRFSTLHPGQQMYVPA